VKKRIVALALAATTMAGGFGLAVAAPGDNGNAGPNGHNEHGLCTAYFNGQKNGHDRNGDPAPFAALITTAGDQDGDGDTDTNDVYQYCLQCGIGGNPGQNGRFTGCFDGDQDRDGDPCNDTAA
jgi:hypothetical protein